MANTYKHKNLTVYIKREYGKSKNFGDIINSLISQEFVDNNRPTMVKLNSKGTGLLFPEKEDFYGETTNL